MTNGWTRGDVFGFLAVVVAIIGIVTAFFSPELRKAIGFDNQQIIVEVKCALNNSSCPNETKPAPIIKPKPTPTETPTPAPDKTEADDEKSSLYATVDTKNDSGLDIRKGKDIESEVIISVPEDEQVEVLFCDNKTVVINARIGEWCHVRYEDAEGWGFGPYFGIHPQTTEINGSNDSNVRFSYIVKTRNHSGLNLRETKNLNADSVSFVPEGEEVEMIYCEEQLTYLKERTGRWCKVEYESIQGWAWGWFLDKRLRDSDESY